MSVKFSLSIIGILLASFFIGVSVQAQESDPWKGSVSAFYRPVGLFGVAGEYFIRPQLSIWGEAAFLNFTKTSVFSRPDTNQGFPLEEFGTFKNVQVRQSYRLGVRHYLDPVPDTWGFFVSGFGGYTNVSDPTAEYIEALQNPGVQTSGSQLKDRVARQQLELGGEIGMRFTVLTQYFLDLSYQGFVERSIKDDDHQTTFSPKMTIGYAF